MNVNVSHKMLVISQLWPLWSLGVNSLACGLYQGLLQKIIDPFKQFQKIIDPLKQFPLPEDVLINQMFPHT